ncbi:MAG: glycosyltransferase [Elusimicrobia bacterium]|nr:glycosyltransferase [Elusimicrobiota bacterium]
MKRQVNKMLQTGGFNAIHIEHLNLWPFVPEGFPVLKVLHQHNLEWLSIKRFADISLNPAKKIFGWMDSIKLKAAEKEACEQADKVLAVSDDVKQRLLSLTNGKIDVSVVRTGIDTEAWRPGDGPCDSSKITFVGKMDYPPNVDGVLWFSSVVFPLIKRWIPSAKFVVVGSNPVSAVRALRRRPGIQVTGFVEDVRPHLRESAVGVFPLRYGGGVKFKILEAMSLGVPTVTTSIGVEGILADSGAEVFVEDKPQAFAQRVIALMTDRGLRLELARRARRRILSLYTREQMRVDIKEAYENLWSR